MKICFVTTGNIKYIAASKRAFGMAIPLSNLGWDVHLILENAEENHKRVAMECNDNITVHYFSKGSALSEIKSKNNIIKLIRPDIIYLCAFVIRNIISGYGAKKIIEHSELQSKISNLKHYRKLEKSFLELYSIFYSSGLLCASKYLDNFYKNKASKFNHKINSLYFPYAYSEKLYKPIPDSNLEQKFITLKDKTNFVYLGTIADNYGAQLMVDAFKFIISKNYNARLIMLGRGRHYDKTIALINEYGIQDNVLMPGFVEEADIEKYFSIANAFISPMNNSIQDWARCPSKLYMYLPFKKPIITCKIGDPYDVLKNEGVYFEAGSAESLSAACISLINTKLSLTLNPKLHTWEQRTLEFDTWIKKLT